MIRRPPFVSFFLEHGDGIWPWEQEQRRLQQRTRRNQEGLRSSNVNSSLNTTFVHEKFQTLASRQRVLRHIGEFVDGVFGVHDA
jgi:hypothetical protein